MPHECPAISVAGRRIAEDIPPFIIAEIGINHGGSPERALALVDAAAAAGAHAIKLQTITADELVAASCPAPSHVKAQNLVEFFRQFELDEAAHHAVAERASLRGLKVISTPFSEAAIDMLERVGVDAYKIASGDLTWDQLIVRAAATGKPLIMSTGMSTLAETHHALAVARLAGAEHVALLHCVSAYPVPKGSENLRAIRTLAQECRVPVGLSDHSDDTFALPIAIGLGASIYERHVVLAEDEDAIDRAVSSTPSELAATIRAGRRAWSALGSGRKACLAAEAANAVASRRSLCARQDLPAGHVLTNHDLVALRPATGVPPAMLASVLGRRLRQSLVTGQPLLQQHLDASSLSESPRVA
jgi:sialic acid synthase SpsE